MARTPKKNDIEAPAEMAPEVAEVLNQTQNTVAVLQAAHSDERDLVNQLLGQAQMADASEQFFRTVRTSKLAYIKENKLYKAIAGMKTPNGSEFLKGTWEEFCVLLGKSVDTIDLDITNLKAFGEEAMDSMSRMGIGYREMRQYRRLPEDEKTALIEAAKTGDKDVFLDLAEEIIAKNAKKEEQLTLELDETKAQLTAKDEVAATNQQRINKLQEQAVLLKKLSPDERTKQLCSEIASQQTGLDEELRTNFYNALATLREHSGDHQAFINSQLQMLDDVVQFLRAEFGGQGLEWEEK